MPVQDVMIYEKRGNIALLVFNRPEALNALNTDVNIKLIELLDRAEADRDVRVVVPKGSGDEAFVAGADIKEMMNKNAMEARAGKIAAMSPHAIALIKSAINKGSEMDIESGTMFEIDCFGLCFSTEEQKQGMLDFVGKKK